MRFQQKPSLLTPTNHIMGLLRRQGALLSLSVLLSSCRHIFYLKKKKKKSETEGLYPKVIFRHLTVTTSWGLQWVQKYNVTENIVYSPGGAQKYLFSKHVVINAYRTNILENKNFGAQHIPPISRFKFF